ncbi:hypothetical protein BDZ45DRAFT_790453 [Acephala macrosclerotiorum]|nr:hypothetical protein BDZ45DRAFT_790453 [Acephala macrosclerotiorum]
MLPVEEASLSPSAFAASLCPRPASNPSEDVPVEPTSASSLPPYHLQEENTGEDAGKKTSANQVPSPVRRCTFVPGAIEIAEKHNAFISGDEYKSGRTKMKSDLIDFHMTTRTCQRPNPDRENMPDPAPARIAIDGHGLALRELELDHGGATVYAKSVIEECSANMINSLFGGYAWAHSALLAIWWIVSFVMYW